MKKNIIFISINLFLIFIILFLTEIIIWNKENSFLKSINVFPPSIQKLKFHPGIKNFSFNPDLFPNPSEGWGRAPEGLEYNNKPIVIFGCSYAYGYNLSKEQTFSYKLANTTMRPVYNRAWTGWSIQHMLYQTRLEKFYKQIPEPEYVIYVYLNDHLRRLYLMSFAAWNILAEEQNLRYKEKDGHLIQIQNKNPLLRQIKRLYLTNELHRMYVEKYILKNHKKCYDFALKHFIESKNEMQKHWKNTKYIILFYNDTSDNKVFKTNLEKNGFIIIDSSDLTDRNLKDEAYMMPNEHPTEAAWDLLVSPIVKELNL